MACDRCGTGGHNESDGWFMQLDETIWCTQCHHEHGEQLDDLVLAARHGYKQLKPPPIGDKTGMKE